MRWRILIGIILAAQLSGCGDYAYSLPNGYIMVHTNAYDIVITNKNHVIIVSPSVVSYNVVNDYVVGKVVIPQLPKSLPYDVYGESKPGYFILNTRTGNLMEGLDDITWRRKLDEIRIHNPDLHHS